MQETTWTAGWRSSMGRVPGPPLSLASSPWAPRLQWSSGSTINKVSHVSQPAYSSVGSMSSYCRCPAPPDFFFSARLYSSVIRETVHSAVYCLRPATLSSHLASLPEPGRQKGWLYSMFNFRSFPFKLSNIHLSCNVTKQKSIFEGELNF